MSCLTFDHALLLTLHRELIRAVSALYRKMAARAGIRGGRTGAVTAVDRAKNPFNIGAIIRTAHSFLAKEIILIGTEPWYERAAMGMQRIENIVEIPHISEFVALSKDKGWKLVSFERDEARQGLWEADIPEDAVLVFGNEDRGVSRRILAASHTVVSIPMFGINHSYPVAVAAGIARPSGRAATTRAGARWWCRGRVREARPLDTGRDELASLPVSGVR